ncbi:hypothetical protein ACG83_11000 [Frankia sp. R43]|uniref:hypothetical protein n=1 Tax=Frankia sp. R43 TaxID=269536 RepID=UPI0006CA2858|nr:hypothetical protein [Frankia sp. R43]KPM55793.1 hypothetical protein ACG83_11000 [Frankia sp. R43]
MTDLARRIDVAETLFTHCTEAAARAAGNLAELLTARVTLAVRDAWPQATDVTVDSDHNLHGVYAEDEKLADDWHHQFEGVAEQVRDDLLLLGQTGQFAEDNRVVNLGEAAS